ncbi:MAG: pantoate--beta-alanine ligase [Bacteroidetes bacterium]|nr:MAG: pantoate--beta-alanine ligase [Bacteroidota bacterium]UCE69869.1 MAG: pantoate--beta-alanine ligase [Flavobacteriaceae bacterium]
MNVLTTKGDVLQFRSKLKENKADLGLVPTMGALHEGHLELVRRACAENEVVMVSVFVNPTQFNNPDDLENYPGSLDEDLEKLKTLSCDIHVFAPDVSEMYGSDISARHYDFKGMDTVMEGAFRPGHFDGVGTIVESLLGLIRPQRAYFGEKDYQQLQIIRQLTHQQKIPVEIIPCPIIREPDGLAMSSRNRLLPKRLRKEAGFIFQTLQKGKTLFGTKSASSVTDFIRGAFEDHPYFKLEYIEIADSETLQPVSRKRNNKKYRAFIAAYLGEVRLIDNIALN